MDRIRKAFSAIARENFLPAHEQKYADIDEPIGIGFGQTNSQPTTVHMMLRWLDPQEGDKILDVGSGSGWTTALLARIVGAQGKVFAVEKIPELVHFGRENVRRAGISNAQFFKAGKVYGWPKMAPYDRILVSAAADHVPKELLDQLKIGGKMVIPVRHDILEITKKPETDEIVTHVGFVFVPLVKVSV